jgi:transcriptional regulator with XRE-family HTH domain
MVLCLVSRGVPDREIAERTGVPRRTVADWRHGRTPDRMSRLRTCAVCAGRPLALPRDEYVYLLGMYLGDGHISPGPRAHRLRFSLDAAYPQIVSACASALERLLTGKSAWVKHRRTSRCVDVVMYSKHWPCLFPQHGPGRKHQRSIVLEPWQRDLLAEAHRSFLRGLIHSDGCRVVANDRGRPSVRYHFLNKSEDIKSLFCESLTALGLSWTRPSKRDVAVYRKADTAFLDGFIGPKA